MISQSQQEKNNVDSHGGHRQRMRKKLLSEGAGKLSDLEILEMLLFYVLPRCDTKKHAQELLKKFGSLQGVLNAHRKDLTSVSGIKDGAEAMFLLLREVVDRCGGTQSKFSVLDTERIKQHLINLYRDLENETVFVLYFAPDGIFIDDQLIYRGGVSSARFSLRAITEGAIRAGASSVILAHNHPSGNLVPSGDDIISTKRIIAHLLANDIEVVEHYIVGKDNCAGMLSAK